MHSGCTASVLGASVLKVLGLLHVAPIATMLGWSRNFMENHVISGVDFVR